MSAAPAVTVVIPTHDRARLLAEAVESVRGQTLRRWELVVVDDRSSDETPAYLAGIDDPRVRSIRLDTNEERSAARNHGLAAAAAAAVLFLDDDDRLLPSALADLAGALDADHDAVAAVGGRIMLRPDGTKVPAAHPRRAVVRSVRTDAFFDWVGFPSQTLFRRDVVEAAGGWDERLTRGEDRDLWIRIADRGPVVFVPEPVAEWRSRGPSREPDAETPAARRSRLLAARAATVRAMASDPQRDRQEDRQRDRQRDRLLAASARWVDGMNAYEDGRYREAAPAFTGAFRLAPQALVSPLVGAPCRRMLTRAWLACVAGARTASWARRTREGSVGTGDAR